MIDHAVYEVECFAAFGAPTSALVRYDVIRILKSGAVPAFHCLQNATVHVWNSRPVCGAKSPNGEYGITCPICVACEGGDLSSWKEMEYQKYIKEHGKITRDNLPRAKNIILAHPLHCCPQIKRHCGPWTPVGRANEWMMQPITAEQHAREIAESKKTQGL